MDNIGERVRRVREELGLTQDSLAKSIGVTQPALSALEQHNKPVGEMSALLMERATGGRIRAVDCVREENRDRIIGLELRETEGAA
jgi:transcriptional regulator with XRE-family HTH domain